RVQLHELRAQQSEIAERIKKASPHLASLHYPEPPSLQGIQEALDPGTLLLAFSVGSGNTIAFAVDRSGFVAKKLDISRDVLRQKVVALQGTIQRKTRSSVPTLRTQASELYQILLAPFEDRIESSERLLISPDGPLHALPFDVLVGGRQPSYLVE